MTNETLKTISADSIMLKVVQAQMTKAGASVIAFDEIMLLLDMIKNNKITTNYLDRLQKLIDSEYKILNQFKLYDIINKFIEELR